MADADLVLVLGATGYVGGRLVPELVRAGCREPVRPRRPATVTDPDAPRLAARGRGNSAT
jgi:uncharacterized protein YbjT (DUF2867 family)